MIVKKILQNLRNISGWSTKRKIVVFQSDDWGSTRMPSKGVYNILIKKGIRIDRSYYSSFDSLESNEDLESLYNVLLKYQDKNGNHPVFTAVMCSANPNYPKIKENNFRKYYYATHARTLKEYGKSHDGVIKLWHEGLNSNLFSPEFHGREHIHIKRWLKAIQIKNSNSQISSEYGFYGITVDESEEERKEFLSAFDIDLIEDNIEHEKTVRSGIELFENEFGFKPVYFVPPNSLVSSELNKSLANNGIKYLSGARRNREPLGGSKYRKNFHYVGKKNEYGQIYLVRNVQFEQGSPSGFSYLKALKDIEVAFRWNKPAIISTHRVNYIGSINEKNRKRGLDELNCLLAAITKKWPDVEFLSTKELGKTIAKFNDKTIE
ncbi:MAG: hypothetical protein L3J06_00500 [Cyclobacteriaceae bacterium]|nr:hypothetical protein [Cyclobacteriaceae bacterium]